MDVTSTVLRHVRMGNAGDPALSLEDEITWTYGDLSSRVNRVANALSALRVAKGDRIGLLLKNCLDYCAAYLAIIRVGAVAVRLNWRLAPPELQYALNDSGTSVLLVHGELLAGYRDVVAGSDVGDVIVIDPASGGAASREFHDFEELLASASADDPDVDAPDFDDPCMIMYTSGTTGYPKGAMWTHGNTLWFGAIQSAYWRFDCETVHFSTGPLFHVGGFEDFCLPTLLGGGHVVILRSGAFDIDRVCTVSQHHDVTTLWLFPAMIYELLNSKYARGDSLASVRRIYTGGSAILLSAVHDLRRLFPGIDLQQAYGLTEGGAITTVMDAGHLDEHPTSVGRPLPFSEIRVAKLDDEQVDAQPEEDGHLWVRSPAVCGSYYNKPDATAETFVDGWCRTGDLAKISEDRFLYITGRVKDMIISGGENIYPVEIENVLSGHPDVLDVAVIGVPHPKWGETPCAVVVLREAATPSAEDLIAFVSTRLAGYKKPRHIEFVSELPRNPSGKILKRVLREQHSRTDPC